MNFLCISSRMPARMTTCRSKVNTCLTGFHVIEDEVEIFIIFCLYDIQKSDNVFVACVIEFVPFSYCRNMTSLKVLWASVALWNASNTWLNILVLFSTPPPASACDRLPSKLSRKHPSPASRLSRISSVYEVLFLKSSYILLLYHI